LNPVEQINYKLMNVQPAKAVIVNTRKANAPIDIGFAASLEGSPYERNS